MTPKTAVIFALFNAGAYRHKLLEFVVQRLRLQTEDLFLGLGIMRGNESPELPTSLALQLDRVLQLSGDSRLFQKEALFNAVARSLPSTIDSIIFLDADMFPLDHDWISKIRSKLDHHDFLQCFSVMFYLGKKATRLALADLTGELSHDVLIDSTRLIFNDRNAHTEDVPVSVSSFGYCHRLGFQIPHSSGGCIAFRRDFFNKMGGLPYDEIFAGLNDLILYYRLGLKKELNPQFFSKPLLDRYNQLEKLSCRFSFVPRRLYHLWHKSGADRQYSVRARLGVSVEYDPGSDVFLNTDGVLELTARGRRLESHMQDISQRALGVDSAFVL